MKEYDGQEHRYDDIISLPHYQSKTRAHMSVLDRAAQFASFAALAGHEQAIAQTAKKNELQYEQQYEQYEQYEQKTKNS